MDPNEMQKIVDYLKEMASPGWEIASRQVMFNRIVDVLIIFVSLRAIWLVFLYMRGKWERLKELWDMGWSERSIDEDSELLWMVGSLVFSAIPALVILLNIIAILNFLINPDWMVIQLVLLQVK